MDQNGRDDSVMVAQPEVDLRARASEEERVELERGLHFSHIMMMVTQDQGEESLALLRALSALLVSKGIISEEELQTQAQAVRQELADTPMPRVRLAEMGDKYAENQNIVIDCENRLHLCHARCCTLRFFLSKQDLDEGVARWDYGNPYWIKQNKDGYCVHNDPNTRFCTIHAKRPHVCRTYDCRNDKRIWLDFENRIPAPLQPLDPPMSVAMASLIKLDEE